MKHPQELEPDDFFELILIALVRHMAHTVPYDISDSAYKVLIEYIEAMHKNGHLKRIITNEPEDAEDSDE